MATTPVPLFPRSRSDLFYRVRAEYSAETGKHAGSPARPSTDLSLFFGAPLLRGFRANVIVPPIVYQRAKLSVKSKRPGGTRES